MKLLAKHIYSLIIIKEKKKTAQELQMLLPVSVYIYTNVIKKHAHM